MKPLHNESNLGSGWLRLPKSPTRLHGLSRSTINELILPCPANGHKAAVKSVLIKKRNASRGIRLIDEQSLLDYLQQLATEQAAASTSSQSLKNWEGAK